jgi:CRISPR system Cascade subunit CasD
MTKTYLRLHLEGVQQSWGEYTSNTERPTLRFPTRSGVGGLLSASLGLFRGDSRIPQLHSSIRVHSRVLREGSVTQDYGNHTNYSPEDGWEAARKGGGGRQASIRDRRLNVFALPDRKLKCEQIRRDFLEDWAFEVLLEVLPGCPFSREELEGALREPRFFQYLGRKACFPLYPIFTGQVEAASPLEGFRLPTPDEVLLEDPSERYAAGGSVHLDCVTLSEEDVPEGFGVLPVNVRDAVHGVHGRIFHERRGWNLVPMSVTSTPRVPDATKPTSPAPVWDTEDSNPTLDLDSSLSMPFCLDQWAQTFAGTIP